MRTCWNRFSMLVCVALTVTLAQQADAQGRNKTKPDVSQGAAVSQVIGVNNTITITYHRPGVKGRNVWKEASENERIGQLVPRDGDPRPWRAGANEPTTFEVTEDVLVEGKELPAGKYALFMIPTDGDWIIIINTGFNKWGAFMYKEEEDVLRVKVTPQEAPHQEWLIFGFEDLEAHGATAYMRWEKVKIPFSITMANKE